MILSHLVNSGNSRYLLVKSGYKCSQTILSVHSTANEVAVQRNRKPRPLGLLRWEPGQSGISCWHSCLDRFQSMRNYVFFPPWWFLPYFSGFPTGVPSISWDIEVPRFDKYFFWLFFHSKNPPERGNPKWKSKSESGSCWYSWRWDIPTSCGK